MTDPFAPVPPSSSSIAYICRCAGGYGGAEHQAREREREAVARADESNRGAERVNRELTSIAEQRRKMDARSPRIDQYEVQEAVEVGNALVMRVKYPNCTLCAYEGSKVMVFLDCTLSDAIRWKKIDPHFRAPKKPHQHPTNEAPSPAARFPGSTEGWNDALQYAEIKSGPIR